MSIGGISNIPIKIAQQTQATIQSRVNEFKTDLHFLIIDKITERLPIHKINKTALDIPNNLELADPTCHIPSDVDMLLGASIFWDLISGGQVRGSNQSIVFQETRLGWIAAGPMETTNACQQKRSYCGMTTTLHKQLEKFWSIEEMVQSPPVSEEEKICEQHFLETHARDSEGRFIVQLPLKGNIDELGESMETATKRFKAIERKLKRQPELKQTYSSFISEYLNLNHMEEVLQKDAQCKLSYYLPHHAVTKEDSETTKVRVVFDASCKSSTGISLNDCLRVGPTIQQDLFSIILRLRQHRYAMSADIAKMYRQVKVIDEHTHLQRILWRWNEDEPIRTFRLKTVTYGLACSSFLAIRCLQEIASQHQKECPEASRAILNDFYVDDLLTGASTVKELKQLRQSTTKILNSAGFELRKWRSNIPEISDKNTSSNSMVEIGEPTKILGLHWDVNQDVFQYRLRLSEETSKITKRKVLTQVSQIYDPLGWLGPSIVKAKILLQRLWQTNKGWDEPISGEMLEMWKQWRSQIHNVQQISIPRRVLENQQDRTELHGFCDASEAAYGACLYIRSSTDENTYITRLLCAKSRIAPLKKVSLPRLELCGAVLLARLSEKASQALNITVHNTYYWSDSTITLSWIGNEPNKWHTFVANRVAEIQRITNKAAWYYVKSEDNPADPLSRGISPDKLKSQTIWWEGPKFLQRNTKMQPYDCKGNEGHTPEGRKVNPTILASVELSSIIERFSSLAKLKRVIAYCLRFKNNSLKTANQTSGPLTVKELGSAISAIVKVCQASEFSQELKDLHKNNRVDIKSKLSTLHPFIDSSGTIRVGGRLRHAPIGYSQKHPIVLPQKHHLTELIIRDTHYKNLHAGPQAVLAAIRNDFWPIAGRSEVRRVLRKCIVCFRARPTNPNQLMGDLPAVRVTQARAFLNTGIDYAGPFSIKITRNKTGKAYLAIFVCLATKAVHFELVSDLTATAFLNALKRFISRRGKCIALYSDNGTTFVGANNQLVDLKKHLLKETTQKQIHEYLAEQFIEWKFIPPYSPHVGGIWEAAVKSAKTHMRKIVGTHLLYFEELYTILTQIEACLNSRPITPISEDTTDFEALTPGHFIIGEAITVIPDRDFNQTPSNHLTRYQVLSQLKQHFWKRWSSEYMSQLQQRFKWKTRKCLKLKIGTMVLVKDERTPPMIWPLGRITEVHPGPDGIIRLVTVRTKQGSSKRTLPKICILPLNDNVTA
ncbi:PREDICTED: uncharacterized protein LOC108762706 [Trachymyrmex cornetzi]|uniref:uncharacterized protein LOC108762706 n=1 Tax=Trachymyrmex cornetzi TaxID=471704 RepID=UPI00084F7683|nr:PREDICTED: uncharacterized protein LOC108762706 [Trachymyrmex cornetzi]